MQKCLAKFIVIFLFAPLILKAQVAELVAHYPLNNSGEELGQKYTSMKLINTIFSGGGTYTEGVYDDFGKQKGNAVLSPFISEWDLGNFYLSLSFKASRLKKMPIFMIGSSARLLGLYISPEGQLQVEINNHNLSYAVEKISLKHSQWYLLQISLKNQELQIFLDKTLIFSKKNIILNEQYISSDKNISSVDFGNGNCFEGYWKDLKISKTSSQSNNGNSETTATALETPIGKWETTEINVPGNATQDYYTKSRRKFFLLKHTDEKLSLIWQDEKSKIIYYTVFSEDLKQGKTSVLNSEKSEKLLAACIDDKNNLYYAVSSDDYERNKGNDILSLYKTDKNGGKILKKSYNSDKKNLDIFAFGNYAAALSYNNQTLAIFMARTMNKSGDGLNHQGGIALVFDSNTLEIIRNTGQTSGHSFDNFLMASKNGNFIGVDLGDNYPRGINLHYLQNNGSRNSRVVYSFKTEHASSPDCPDGKSYPIYKEISTPQKKYYQWSNDNGTYSQLGGIIETDAAFLVLFTGEPDTQGKALNSSRVGEHTDPRNIGFVKLSKDFYSYEKKLNEVVLTEGSKEVGGFYTFGGYWSKQENYGIKWLSNYKDKNKQSASHLKTCLLANGNVLLLWKLAPYDEYFSKIPPRSQMMVIDENGKVVLPPTDLGESIKLNRRDELMLVKNKVICVDGSNEKIILHTLTLK